MKALASVILFLTMFYATAFGQAHVPTLQSNNSWTGTNSYQSGKFLYGSGTQQCPQGAGYFMTGINQDLSPSCQLVSATAGVSSINTRQGAISLLGTAGQVVITEGPNGTFTFSSPGSGVTSINGANGPIVFANGTNINIVESPTGTFTINCPGCSGGGGGSGVVGNGANRAFPVYQAAGTSVNGSSNLFSLDNTMSLSAIQTLINANNCGLCNGTYNTILIPDGVAFQPWTNQTAGFPASNPGTGMHDFRTGTEYTQMTRYGLVPDAAQIQASITASSTTVTVNTGVRPFSCPSNSFPCTSGGDVGKTVSFGGFSGNYYTGTQYRFVPTIVSIQSNSSATLSTTSPVSLTNVLVWKGTDNCSAFSSAMVGLAIGSLTGALVSNGLLGLLPAGYMLTTCSIPWEGSASWMGMNMSDSTIIGTPGKDVIVATNNGGVGLYFGRVTLAPDGSISASQHPYVNVEANGTTTNVQPFYRPLHVNQPDSNNPLAQGWCASCDNNYVATITQNSNTICIPTGLTRVPTVGDEIVFPYTPAVFKSSVTSNTGSSCGAGFVTTTISPSVPNTAGYTLIQTPFYASLAAAGIQHLAVAIPAGTVNYGTQTITFANPTQPYPGSVNNVALHGHIKVGSEEYDYMGCRYSSPFTCILQAGPASSVGWSIMEPVVPLNPCYANFEVPYPVVPTVNSGQATPINAVFFPGLCGGNFAISEPNLDGLTDTGGSFFRAHLEDVAIYPVNVNPGKGCGAYYFAGNHAPYATTFYDWRIFGCDYGLAEGPASKNEWNIASVGPTGDGNDYTNFSVTSAYILSLIGQQDTNINRWDAYSTEYNPFDGTPIGSTSAIYLGYTKSEISGGGVQGTASVYVTNWNAEPENGSHLELPPYFYDGCNVCTFQANSFEGAGVTIDGSNNTISEGQLGASPSNPLIIYGNNNTITDTIDTSTGKIGNTFGISSVLNWGQNNTISVPGAYGSGQFIAAAPGAREKTSGYDSGSFRDGLAATPYVTDKEGYFSPYEFGPQVGAGVDPSPFQIGPILDSTAPISGSYVGCNINSGGGCSPFHIGGFFGPYYIGQDQRVVSIPYVVTTSIKTTSNQSMNYQINALDPGGSNDTCSGNANIINTSITTIGGQYTTISLPGNFTGHTGCILQFVFQQSTTSDVAQVAYMDFQPIPKIAYLSTVSNSIEGTSCPAPGVLGQDGSFLYVCAGTGPYTVKRTPLT